MKRRDFLRRAGTSVAGGMLGLGAAGQRLGATAPGAAARKNVLFIMTDQWRHHAMGYAGMDPVTTPVLDELASRSFRFDNAIASSPSCCPNRACWMTGRYHQGHGVVRNEDTHVRPEQILVSNFKEAGYATGYIGKWHLSGSQYPRNRPTPEFLRKDFDYWYRAENHTHFAFRYDENGTMVDRGRGWQPAHEVDKAIEYLRQPRDNPFFLVLSFGPPHNGVYPGPDYGPKRHTPGDFSHRAGGYGYYAPHEFEAPYQSLTEADIRPNILPIRVQGGPDPRETESCLGAVPGYFGACSALDADLGRLLAFLRESGLEDDTILVFTSDHGEMLGSQGLMTKGVAFEESIRVPMLLHVPGLEGGVSDRLFNSPDVLPTLMGLTNVRCAQAGVEGVDHSPFLRGDEDAGEPEMAYIGFANFRGFRTKRYTYVAAYRNGAFGGREGMVCRRILGRDTDHLLFDLREDPYQQRPIQRGHSPATDALIDDFHAELRSHLAARGEELA